jgi:hypothetical protein
MLSALDLDIRSFGDCRRRQLTCLFLEGGRSFNEPRSHARIRGRLRHLEQRGCCLAGMEAVLCHVVDGCLNN